MAEEIIQAQESAAPEQSLEQVIAANPAYREQYKAMLEGQRQSWQRKADADASEAEKLAKMSAEQRERYQFDKEKADFAKERETFQRQQLEIQMGAELQKLGYSADFARFITGKDAEESMQNLNALNSHIKAEIQKSVNGMMRGRSAPETPVVSTGPLNRESLQHMTPAQIVKAHREGRLDALMGK